MDLIRNRPGALLRFFLRAPILLYRIGLGSLFGQRFLLLTHTGRRSGQPRQAVIEVMRHDTTDDTYIVAAAWGRRSDWFRNIEARPEVSITVRRSTTRRQAHVRTQREARDEFLRYAQTYPTAFRTLTRSLTGSAIAPSPEACDRLARLVPVVAFEPVQS
jgi:deazaflavin-dependent oxidoreductase (nitroreductase family)